MRRSDLQPPLEVLRCMELPAETALTFDQITDANAADQALKASDLKVDNTIKIVATIVVDGSGDAIPQIAVRLSIGGIDAATQTFNNETTSFEVTFKITLKASQETRFTTPRQTTVGA